MSTFPQEPDDFGAQIDDAFMNFMIEQWYYIRLGTGVQTNPEYKWDIKTLTSKWMNLKKEQFGTTSNTEPKWTSKTKKASSR